MHSIYSAYDFCKSKIYQYFYLWVPPIPGIRPSLSSGRANFASSEQTIISQSSEISNPPPKATPLTAAIIGFLAE